jgi:hypothetical protein
MSVFLHLIPDSHEDGIVIEILKEYKEVAFDRMREFTEYNDNYLYENKSLIHVCDVTIPEYDSFHIYLSDQMPYYPYIHYRFFPTNETSQEDWYERFQYFLEDWMNLMSAEKYRLNESKSKKIDV